MDCDESDLIEHDWIDTGENRLRCRNCGSTDYKD